MAPFIAIVAPSPQSPTAQPKHRSSLPPCSESPTQCLQVDTELSPFEELKLYRITKSKEEQGENVRLNAHLYNYLCAPDVQRLAYEICIRAC
ncbi:hypothetical protein PO909_006982 [Leuciscus waleckii]